MTTAGGNTVLETVLADLTAEGDALDAAVAGDRQRGVFIYRLRAGQLEMLTVDHSQVMEMVKQGVLRLDEAWERVGHDVAVMGNLDPVSLFAKQDSLREQAKRIMDQAGGRPGHIFNLGHGILPETPVENVIALVEMVHEMSAK